MRSTVTRLEVGGFLASPGGAPAERFVVNAWLVRHPEATILVDTGIADHLPPEDVEELQFVQTPIVGSLAGIGVAPADVDLVINCHLHADHAGGNAHFRGTPILVQAAELAAARAPDYTRGGPDAVDLDLGRYEVRDGEHEPLPGLRVIPTPGHSPGHQSVCIETDGGPLILAGQCFRDASSFARATTALDLARAGYERAPDVPDWLPRLLELGPSRVMFGHDRAVWQADA